MVFLQDSYKDLQSLFWPWACFSSYPGWTLWPWLVLFLGPCDICLGASLSCLVFYLSRLASINTVAQICRDALEKLPQGLFLSLAGVINNTINSFCFCQLLDPFCKGAEFGDEGVQGPLFRGPLFLLLGPTRRSQSRLRRFRQRHAPSLGAERGRQFFKICLGAAL